MDAGWHYGYGWYDPLVNRTKDFHAFAYNSKDRRSPDRGLPSRSSATSASRATAAIPARTSSSRTVLRWVSPADGEVRIDGTLEHTRAAGRRRPRAHRQRRRGKLGEWTATTKSSPPTSTKSP